MLNCINLLDHHHHVRSCLGEDGKDDTGKGTQLLEVYALQIQVCSELDSLVDSLREYTDVLLSEHLSWLVTKKNKSCIGECCCIVC